jgi:hypothetical protein
LIDGISSFLVGPELRLKLLRLLLANVGLLEAVKLAPEQRWREALDRTYGAA